MTNEIIVALIAAVSTIKLGKDKSEIKYDKRRLIVKL